MTESLKLSSQYCFPLYSAANKVVRTYRPFLKTIDLTYPQYLAMMVLWENESILVGQLGKRLNLDSGTLTPLLKRLENKQLVSRHRGSTDERERLVKLTSRGRALQPLAEEIPKQVAGCMKLNLDELEQLRLLCKKLLD